MHYPTAYGEVSNISWGAAAIRDEVARAVHNAASAQIRNEECRYILFNLNLQTQIYKPHPTSITDGISMQIDHDLGRNKLSKANL